MKKLLFIATATLFLGSCGDINVKTRSIQSDETINVKVQKNPFEKFKVGDTVQLSRSKFPRDLEFNDWSISDHDYGDTLTEFRSEPEEFAKEFGITEWKKAIVEKIQ